MGVTVFFITVALRKEWRSVAVFAPNTMVERLTTMGSHSALSCWFRNSLTLFDLDCLVERETGIWTRDSVGLEAWEADRGGAWLRLLGLQS